MQSLAMQRSSARIQAFKVGPRSVANVKATPSFSGLRRCNVLDNDARVAPLTKVVSLIAVLGSWVG